MSNEHGRPRKGRPFADWSSGATAARVSKLRVSAKLATIAKIACERTVMKTMSAKDAKNGFGRLIDTARAEPVMIEKHGRGVVVVLAAETYQRLMSQKASNKENIKHPGGGDSETFVE